MASVMLYSCEKSKEEPECPCIRYETAVVNIRILNKDSEDLLSPATKGHFSFDNMKLYYVVKGDNRDEVYPLKMMLVKEASPNFLQLYLNLEKLSDKKQRIVTSYLQLSDGVTDTIKVEVDDCFMRKKMWYNGKLCKFDDMGIITIHK